MPVFTYTARDRLGNLTTGTVEAESDSRAAARLREDGLWVTDLRAAAAAARKREAIAAAGPVETSIAKQLANPVPLKDLALFYRQLYTLLNSGMALYQALELMSQGMQTPNSQLRRVAGELARQVLSGGTLSAGMARFPWLFDRMQLRMMQAGEQGGLLVEILGRLSTYLEKEYNLRLEIKRRTLYPKLLLLALILIPPIPTLVLRGFGPYAAEVWGVVSGVIIVGIPLFFLMRLLLKIDAIRDLYDQVKLALPILGPLIRKMAIARFSRSLAALYAAGVPIASALAMAGESAGNAALEKLSHRMAPGLERGASIAQVTGASGFFPPMFVGMVGTGESSGNLDQMLDKAADFYEEESSHATIQLVVILGVLLLLIMGILIGIKVIGYWTGYSGSVINGAGGAGE
jgi:type IV pilus assembly protein PilC